MQKDKRSFFERLTGSVSVEDRDTESTISSSTNTSRVGDEWLEEDSEEGELTVDVYQTANEIVIQTMVAGVKPEDLSVNISRDMVTIKGSRERISEATDDNYFQKELYWGAFSRTILLPAEVEAEEAEAIEKHGLLTIRLPKIDKDKVQKIRVKSI